MKTGFKFYNEGTEYTVVLYEKHGKHDLALLLYNASTDCPFLTIRDLTKMKDGYSWYWSHYFKELDDAVADFKERRHLLK